MKCYKNRHFFQGFCAAVFMDRRQVISAEPPPPAGADLYLGLAQSVDTQAAG